MKMGEENIVFKKFIIEENSQPNLVTSYTYTYQICLTKSNFYNETTLKQTKLALNLKKWQIVRRTLEIIKKMGKGKPQQK